MPRTHSNLCKLTEESKGCGCTRIDLEMDIDKAIGSEVESTTTRDDYNIDRDNSFSCINKACLHKISGNVNARI